MATLFRVAMQGDLLHVHPEPAFAVGYGEASRVDMPPTDRPQKAPGLFFRRSYSILDGA